MRDPIPGHENLTGRLAIPYITWSGVVNMNFRCLRPHVCKEVGCPKYMVYPGLAQGANLYNVKALQGAGQSIAMAEGEISALSSTLAGIPCVATGGAEKFQAHWKLIFEDFTNVYIWREGDGGGEKFVTLIKSNIPWAIPIELPSGEDPNSLWVSGGAQALRELVRK